MVLVGKKEKPPVATGGFSLYKNFAEFAKTNLGESIVPLMIAYVVDEYLRSDYSIA